MSRALALSRRGFLSVSTLAGGGLLLGLRLPDVGPRPAEALAPNAFVRIGTDGQVTVIVNKSEMGQGISTSLPLVLAEELDADWSRVGFEFAPADPVYAHPGYGIQMTGGSTSTMAMTQPMREAGAAARAMLVAAAAARWQVAPADCRTEPGFVVHPSSGRRAPYGELASEASKLPVPTTVELKDPSAFRLVGKPTHRLDSRDKIEGRALFGLDVQLPGLLTAVVAHPPTFGGKAASYDEAAALRVPGVRKVVDVGSGVAVIGEGFWPAKKGRDALKVQWSAAPDTRVSSEELFARYRELARTPGLVAAERGDCGAALAGAARTLEAEYDLPYLAHAPMEPLNCTVDLREDGCEIWAGTQFQTVDQAAAAQALGLRPEQVSLHTTFLGGGFGRRANPASDYVVEACKVAKTVKGPVKLVWTREDDMRGGYYRPMWHSRVRAGLDGAGELVAWSHTIVGQSILAGTPFEAFLVKDGIDGTSVEGAADTLYAFPNSRVDLHTTQTPVPTLWWRSVGHSHTAFVIETFLDEVAEASGIDPLVLRRKLLAGEPRHLAVLELAAREAGYGKPLAAGHAHGLASHYSFNSHVAVVLEAALEGGRPRVQRVTCAVDCGRTINPDTVRAQLEGAVGFALTTALYSEISLEAGKVRQSNFHDYRLLRIHEMPAVDVHIVASEEPPTGVGEPGVPPVAPALANALHRLTGKRLRRLPIRLEDLR